MDKNDNSHVSKKRPLSAIIMADIEGIIGVSEKRQCKARTKEWKDARGLITDDVNAAVKGLKKAGISEITVFDMHGTGFNILPKRLEKGAICRQGHSWRPIPLMGRVPKADFAIMIGWHAGPDQKDGFSPHMFHKRIRRMEINGNPITEVELFSGVLGEMGLPVLFVSGESVALDRIRKTMPWIDFLHIPKRALSPGEKETLREQLELKCRECVKNAKSAPLLIGPHKVSLKTIFNLYQWKSDSFLETYKRALTLSVFYKIPEWLCTPGLLIYKHWSRMQANQSTRSMK